MCGRIFWKGIILLGAVEYLGVSYDARITPNRSFDEKLKFHIISFQDCDKPGVMMHTKTINASEFTNVIPNDCLSLEYLAHEAEEGSDNAVQDAAVAA